MQIKFPVPEEAAPTSFLEKVYPYRFFVLGLVVLFSGFGWLLWKRNAAKYLFAKEFVRVDQMVEKLSRGEDVSSEAIVPFLAKRPDLGSYLEEKLVLEGKKQEGIAVGEKTIERLGFFEGPYLDYARTSLLIEQGSFEKALESARLLDAVLAEKISDSPRLYLFNLVRIAFLEEKLGAVGSWSKVKEALTREGDPAMEELQAELLSHFSDERASILK